MIKTLNFILLLFFLILNQGSNNILCIESKGLHIKSPYTMGKTECIPKTNCFSQVISLHAEKECSLCYDILLSVSIKSTSTNPFKNKIKHTRTTTSNSFNYKLCACDFITYNTSFETLPPNNQLQYLRTVIITV